ncbi:MULTISPECIES: hypothetical protein [Acinetobacter]|uniref:hypothetical protein n=1 Tax=Acinetobacter TaxID=469 RepID=UPI000C4EFCFF|nr:MULTISPECIES: hypothetical protein [unclassified Acinetobacter]MBC68732.1 hypothetical protein [Acinetobacter sp.]MBT51205.1 hypothetical protein [Acinetobacter sp.]
MTVYSVSYDLNKSGQKYDELIKEIKSFDGWCHAMDSYWFVCSSQSAAQVYERLRKHTDDNDDLFVMQTSKECQGWLSKTVWEWINKHI